MELTKVIFFPCVFELMSTCETEEAEYAHLTHLQSVLNFLQKLNVEFDLYENAPYFPDAQKRPPISRYHYNQVSCSMLYAKIQRKITYDPIVLLSPWREAKIISDYTYPKNSETKESFLRYISYLNQNSKRHISFIGLPNCNKPKPVVLQLPDGTRAEMMPIFQPMNDCSGQMHDILPVQDESSYFPNKNYCKDLNKDFIKKRHGENIAPLIIKYGTEAALRNGYIEDPQLSALNSKKQNNRRIVFRKKDGSKMYLSLDFESGGFEVFDHTPTHLGQFSFAGDKVKPAEPHNHKLYFS